MDELDDELTPLPVEMPDARNLPMEVYALKQQLQKHRVAIARLHTERVETRRGFRSIWLGLLGIAATIVITAGAALLQMGAYMERIDNVADSQRRIEQRLDGRLNAH